MFSSFRSQDEPESALLRVAVCCAAHEGEGERKSSDKTVQVTWYVLSPRAVKAIARSTLALLERFSFEHQAEVRFARTPLKDSQQRGGPLKAELESRAVWVSMPFQSLECSWTASARPTVLSKDWEAIWKKTTAAMKDTNSLQGLTERYDIPAIGGTVDLRSARAQNWTAELRRQLQGKISGNAT